MSEHFSFIFRTDLSGEAFDKLTNTLTPFCDHSVLSLILVTPPCCIDLEQLEMERVNEKVLRITDCLVRSGREGRSLCVLSAEDEFSFICHQIFPNGTSKPNN